MQEPCYADMREAWWRAHADGCGWEPAAEHDVRAWMEELEARTAEERERWETPARAGASAAALIDALAIDLHELAPREASDEAKHWVEVRIIDEHDAPIRGVALTLIRPDGARERASTDDDGVARWRKLPGGRPRVVFDDDAASFAEVG